MLAARDAGQPPDAPWLEQGGRLVAARTLLAPRGRYFPGLSEPTPPGRLVDVVTYAGDPREDIGVLAAPLSVVVG